ncbi:MAG: hypothetical protein NC124_15630 [Clostridium sp.]|nr:hypothetical protein [Clostridium sp.]
MKADEKQQEIIGQFFKEWTSWCPWHVIYNLLAAIFIGISVMMWIMPFQVWDRSEDLNVLMIFYGMELAGISFYEQKYLCYMEEQKEQMLYRVLRYLPVSDKQLHIFRIRKVAKLCLWLTGVIVTCQVAFAILFLHTFSVGNILIPLFGNFTIPLGLMYMGAIAETKRSRRNN